VVRLIAAVREWLVGVYSVEKLGSCDFEILPMNQIAGENQAQIRDLTSHEQLSLEIVGSCWSVSPFKIQPF
jgi:hypothetical protein